MSTTIEWTQRPGTRGETWNPTTGCNKVSQGCKHCYAETMHSRLQAMGVKGYEHPFLSGARPQPHTLERPLKWKKPRTVFVNSMSDLFHEAVPFSFIDRVFAVMALCPQHTFLILTKRPERMAEYMQPRDPLFLTDRCLAIGQQLNALRSLRVDEAHPVSWPLPNVWLGTSVEDQKAAEERTPHLLRCPAAVRFLSCEPLLGSVDLKGVYYTGDRTGNPWPNVLGDGIHWVIAGGESGHGARPMHPDWARSLRDQCQVARVPFFMKQWGAFCPEPGILHRHHAATKAPHTKYTFPDGTATYQVGKKAAGRLLDGVEHNAWPEAAAELQLA